MNENKQLICDLLYEALKATRDQADLNSVEYGQRNNGDEVVILTYNNGYTKSINVSCDSGIAMMRDILKEL